MLVFRGVKMSEKCLPFSIPFFRNFWVGPNIDALWCTTAQGFNSQRSSAFRRVVVFWKIISPSKNVWICCGWFHYLKDMYIYNINQALSSKKKPAKKGFSNWKFGHTVDGSEIQRSPVEVGSFSPLFTKVLYKTPVVIAGFLNHQQYLRIIDQSELPTSSTHNSDGLKNHGVEPPFAACEEIQHSNGTIFEQVHGGHLKKVAKRASAETAFNSDPKKWWFVKK